MLDHGSAAFWPFAVQVLCSAFEVVREPRPANQEPLLAFSTNSSLEAPHPKAEVKGLHWSPPFMTNSSQIGSRAGVFQSLKDAKQT